MYEYERLLSADDSDVFGLSGTEETKVNGTNQIMHTRNGDGFFLAFPQSGAGILKEEKEPRITTIRRLRLIFKVTDSHQKNGG